MSENENTANEFVENIVDEIIDKIIDDNNVTKNEEYEIVEVDINIEKVVEGYVQENINDEEFDDNNAFPDDSFAYQKQMEV